MASLVVLNGPLIRAGESLSEGINTQDRDIVRLTMPSEWDNAPISFQFSTDGTFYNDLFHVSGVPGSYTAFEVVLTQVEAGVGVVVPIGFSRGIVWFKVRSGTRDTPVEQSADRNFALSTYTGSV